MTEFYDADYVAPLDVKVYGEVKGGKTTIIYEGFVTTKNNETKDYFVKKTFDFVLVPNEELPK